MILLLTSFCSCSALADMEPTSVSSTESRVWALDKEGNPKLNENRSGHVQYEWGPDKPAKPVYPKMPS